MFRLHSFFIEIPQAVFFILVGFKQFLKVKKKIEQKNLDMFLSHDNHYWKFSKNLLETSSKAGMFYPYQAFESNKAWNVTENVEQADIYNNFVLYILFLIFAFELVIQLSTFTYGN